MRYAVASQSTGRVLDMRDVPYTENDLLALGEAYGLDDLVVHQDFDASVLQSKACEAVKIEDGVLVDDVAASADAAHAKAMATVVSLYQVRVAVQSAISDGFALEDELAAVEARINELRGDLAEIVARRVDDASFFTRLLIYLGLK